VILVDSSAWIDFFRGDETPQVEWLDRHLGDEILLVGDLILAEVLAGFKQDKGFAEAKRMLGRLEQVALCGTDIAIESAQNYRRLRSLGVTVRGTVDLIIATRCLVNGYRLLHGDRDFDSFAEHLNLRVVDCRG